MFRTRNKSILLTTLLLLLIGISTLHSCKKSGTTEDTPCDVTPMEFEEVT